MYGKNPPAPEWLKKYVPGADQAMSQTTETPQYVSDEIKTVQYPGTLEQNSGSAVLPSPIIGQGGEPMFIVRDNAGNLLKLIPLSEGQTGVNQTTKSWNEITPQWVNVPSGQWLNQAAPTVKQGLQGYSNWSAGQNKSLTWEDLMNQVNQMLPTNEPYSTRRWQSTKKAGW